MTLLSAEWLKLRSVRSTHLILAISLAAVAVGVAVAWSAVGMLEDVSPERRAIARMTELEEVVLIIPQLCLGILGALAMTSEYATGLIRVSLTVVPRRWPVLAAKAAVVGAVATVVGPLVMFGTYFACRAIVGDLFLGVYATPFADRLLGLIVSGLSVTVFALLGLGLGAILRSTAGAVSVLVGLVYVVPMIVGNLPEPWSERLGSVMIGGLPRQITGDDLTNSVFGALLPPPVAAAVLLAYAVIPLALAAPLLRSRDT